MFKKILQEKKFRYELLHKNYEGIQGGILSVVSEYIPRGIHWGISGGVYKRNFGGNSGGIFGGP